MLLRQARVLGQGGEQLLHHGAGAAAGLRAQRQRAAVGRRVAALVAVVGGGGGLAHRGAAVGAGAQGVAAEAEASAGHGGAGRLAEGAAGAPQAARGGPVGAHQGGGQLAGVVGQVHVDGCRGEDSRRVRDPHVCQKDIVLLAKVVECVGMRGVERPGRREVLLTAARLAVVLTDVVVHVVLAVVI